MKKRPIDYRDHRLVIALLGLFYEAIEDVDPRELVDLFASPTWSADTIKRTIADLVSFGAIRRVQSNPKNPRARSGLRLTELGRAWIDRRVEPYIPRARDSDGDGSSPESEDHAP